MKHSGVISKITNSSITVSLEGNINCSSCKAKAACGVSESNSKEIEITKPSTGRDEFIRSFNLNEGVDVNMSTELGLKAVFWAYVFPFILMITVLIVSSNYLKEWMAGLLSVSFLIPYYLMLYILRDQFKKIFKISILKTAVS